MQRETTPARTCGLPGCTARFYARGMCNRHYLLSRKHPDATRDELAEMRKRAQTPDEVRALLLRRSVAMPSGCREWRGATDRSGYGNVRWERHLWGAHRLSFHLFVRPVTPGLEVCHTCDNPPCIEPSHLFEGTHLVNVHDARDKGRMAGNGGRSGAANGRAKLTEADVRAIRADARPIRVIGQQYGIHPSTAAKIRSGQGWPSVS